MSIPPLEPSEHFTILAQAPGVALVQHKLTGRLYIERLTWRCSGPDSSFDEPIEAWEQYLKECM